MLCTAVGLAVWVCALTASVSGASGDCSGHEISRCSNVITWDGDRPELVMNVEAGDRHTDENGYCMYGFTGPDDHCRTYCDDGVKEYVCKCVSLELAIELHKEEESNKLIPTACGVCVCLLGAVWALQGGFIGQKKKAAVSVGVVFIILGVGVFAWWQFFRDPERYFIGCTERGGAGTTQ